MAYSITNPLYPKRSMDSAGAAVATQTITVTSAAIAAPQFNGSTHPTNPNSLVFFDVQANSVRVRWDGTNPSATTGHILAIGPYIWNVDRFNASVFFAVAGDGVIYASAMQC